MPNLRLSIFDFTTRIFTSNSRRPTNVNNSMPVHRRRRRGAGGERAPTPPQKEIREKYFSGNRNYRMKSGHFSGKYRVKFGHFVNFSYIYLRAKMSCPQS